MGDIGNDTTMDWMRFPPDLGIGLVLLAVLVGIIWLVLTLRGRKK